MEGEYVGKHSAKANGGEVDPWAEVAAMADDYVPKHAKKDELKEPSEVAEQNLGLEPEWTQEQEQSQEEAEAKEMEKRRLVEALEEAKEELKMAERGFEEADEYFGETVKRLENGIEENLDVDDLKVLLKRANEALEEYDEMRKKLSARNDDFDYYAHRAMPALQEEELQENRERSQEVFEKTEAAKRKVNQMDDRLYEFRREILRRDY